MLIAILITNDEKLSYDWGCFILSIQFAGGCGQAEKFCNGWLNRYWFSDDGWNPPICNWPNVLIIGLTLDEGEFKLLTECCGNW